MIIQNDPGGSSPAAGRKFFVSFVFQGERYGLNKSLTHKERVPMVEIYDATYLGDPKLDDPRGQFVSRYNVDQFIRLDVEYTGLDLYGGEPAWKLDKRAMGQIVASCMTIAKAMKIPPSKW